MFKLLLHLIVSQFRAKPSKTLIVGLLISLGSFIGVVGKSLVDSVSSGMEKSLVGGPTGHAQFYSSKTEEELSVLGSMNGDFPELPIIKDCDELKKTLMDNIPSIKEVIPEGINFAMVNPGNILDVKLEKLRSLYKSTNPDEQVLKSEKEHLIAIIKNINESYSKSAVTILSLKKGELEENLKYIEESLTPTFWSETMIKDPLMGLEFLENKIAPLIFDDTTLYFNYIGADPDLYEKNFPLFNLVKGNRIPKGERGLLLNDYFYETQAKSRVARRLDDLKKGLEKEKRTLLKDEKLQDLLKQNREQASEFINQIPPSKREELLEKIKNFLKNQKVATLEEGIVALFTADDSNFIAHYNFFYQEITPLISLYKFPIGEAMTITTIGRNSKMSKVNVIVYGTFKYKNFENSALLGNYSLMDMDSYRQLLGEMSSETKKEVSELSKEMDLMMEGKDTSPNSNLATNPNPIPNSPPSKNCVNGAIILKSGHDKADDIITLKRDVKKLSDSKGLQIKVVSWMEAAGFIGKMIGIFNLILYLSLFILFSVSIFIMMNSLVMATFERIKDFGVMRAIGAEKSFIVKLILLESTFSAFLFCTFGVFLGVALLTYFHFHGIEATEDIFYFLFSGSHLYPSFSFITILGTYLVSLTVALLASIYPAIKATRYSPLKAILQEY